MCRASRCRRLRTAPIAHALLQVSGDLRHLVPVVVHRLGGAPNFIGVVDRMVAAVVTVPRRFEPFLGGQEFVSGFLRAVAGRPECGGEVTDLARRPRLNGAVQFPRIAARRAYEVVDIEMSELQGHPGSGERAARGRHIVGGLLVLTVEGRCRGRGLLGQPLEFYVVAGHRVAVHLVCNGQRLVETMRGLEVAEDARAQAGRCELGRTAAGDGARAAREGSAHAQLVRIDEHPSSLVGLTPNPTGGSDFARAPILATGRRSRTARAASAGPGPGPWPRRTP